MLISILILRAVDSAQKSKTFYYPSSLQAFKLYASIYKEQKKGHPIEKHQQHIFSFFKRILFKE